MLASWIAEMVLWGKGQNTVERVTGGFRGVFGTRCRGWSRLVSIHLLGSLLHNTTQVNHEIVSFLLLYLDVDFKACSPQAEEEIS